jgi:hypothetical protein
MRKILIPSMLLAFFNPTSFAQNVGIGTTTPGATAMAAAIGFLKFATQEPERMFKRT